MASAIKWAIYATQKAYNHNPGIQQITKNYVEECFSATTYSLDITLPSHNPDPPEEHSLGGSDGSINNDTCKTSYDDFPYLNNWLWAYIECNNLPLPEDGVLMVTDSNRGGGISDGTYSTADAGQACEYLSTSITKEYACDRAYRDMAAAAQELGHNLSLSHDPHGYAYEDYYDPAFWYSTPLRAGYEEVYDEKYNDCGSYIGNYNSSTHDACYDFNWSDCSVNNITQNSP